MLPVPRLNILVDFEAIFKAFQDIRFIGVLRQRWEEIKKLQASLQLLVVNKLQKKVLPSFKAGKF